MSDAIRITKAAQKKQKPKDKDLAFGTDFTDHMFLVDFEDEKGWYDPRIEPYGPLALDPATAVLHYGQGLFEGLKAFRGKDGKIRLFRPDKHVARLNRTAETRLRSNIFHPTGSPLTLPPRTCQTRISSSPSRVCPATCTSTTRSWPSYVSSKQRALAMASQGRANFES